MRLTAPCICRSLLALSCLSWIRGDPEEVNLLEWGDDYGPCTATLTPKEPCRQGQHGSTCPYLFSLPPLTVHLPQQLRELEKIMQDLETLKDSVDELRKMCGDCRPSEKECRKQRERGHEGEDDMSWINQTPPAINMDVQQRHGTDIGKLGNTEGDGDTQRQIDWNEKNRKAERETDKRKEKEMPVTKEPEHYERTQKEGTKEDDKLEQTELSPSEKIVIIGDAVEGNAAEQNSRERKTNKYTQNPEEGLNQDQKDLFEKETETNKTSNIKPLTNTDKDGLYLRQNEKEKLSLIKVSDRKKMSEDLGGHTDQELEKRKEIERSLNLMENNKKPKQTESIGHAGRKEKTVIRNEKVEEGGREEGMEIKQLKADGQQGDRDENKRKGFASVIPTPDSTAKIRVDSSDSDKIINFTSSFPSPLLHSLSSDKITDVSHERITTSGPTQRSHVAAAGISEPLKPDKVPVVDVPTKSIVGGPTQQISGAKAGQNTSAKVKPEAGLQGHNTSTATSRASSESSDVTTLPRAGDRSRWMAKKNISSTTKASMKPLPARVLKQKVQKKPEADQKLKNAKNERRVSRPPFPDKKLNYDQKPKPSNHKPNANQTKGANFSKTIQNRKHKEETPADSVDQNDPPAQRIKTHTVNDTQESNQRPRSTNSTNLDENSRLSHVRKSTISQNSELGRNQFYPAKIKPSGKQRPEIKTQIHQPLEKAHDHTPVQDHELHKESTSKEDLLLGEILIPEQSDQKSQSPRQIPVVDLTKKKTQDPISKEDSNLGEKNIPNQGQTLVNQTIKIGKNHPSDSIKKPDQSFSSPSSFHQYMSPKIQVIPTDEQNTTLDQVRQPIQKIPKPLQDPITKPLEVLGELLPFMPTSDKDSDEIHGKENIPQNISERLKIKSSPSFPKAKPKSATETSSKAVKNLTSHDFGFLQEMTPGEKTRHDKANTSPDQATKIRQNIPNLQPYLVTKPSENIEYNHESEPVSKKKNNPAPDHMSAPSEKRRQPYQTLPVPKSMGKSDENIIFQPRSEEDSTRKIAMITPDLEKIPRPTKNSESFKESNRSLALSKFDEELPPEEESPHIGANTLTDQMINSSKKEPILDHEVTEPSENVEEPTSTEDSISEKKPTPDKESQTLTNQRLNSRKKVPIMDLKPITEPGENVGEGTTFNDDSISEEKATSHKESQQVQKPPQMSFPEARQEVDGHLTIKTMSDKDSTPEERTVTDQINTPPDQKSPPKQSILNLNGTLPIGSDVNLLVGTTSNQGLMIGRPTADKLPEQKLEIGSNKNPKIKLNSGQLIKSHPRTPKLVTDLRRKSTVGRKTDQPPQTNHRPETPRIDPNPNPLPDEISIGESSKTTKQKLPLHLHLSTSRPTFEPGTPSVPKPKLQEESHLKSKTNIDLPLISRTNTDSIPNAQTKAPPLFSSERLISKETHSPKDAEFEHSMKKIIHKKEDDPKTLSDDFTTSMNSWSMSDLKPITSSPLSQNPTTPSPNNGVFPEVIPSIVPRSITLNRMLKPTSNIPTNTIHKEKDEVSTLTGPSPSLKTTSTLSSDFRSITPATSGLRLPAAESSTPSARELRVKINQVAAFLNNGPKGRPPVRHPQAPPEDIPGDSRPDKTQLSTLTTPTVSSVITDCSGHLLMGHTHSGVYQVSPTPRSSTFRVFCDMELEGGGWTVLQRRQDGTVSFNRSWAEYRSGFGELDHGEFWLGNDLIHLLTRDRVMILRVELEDFEGVSEYAQYKPFRVASERLHYRLTVGAYSGTAGNALRFNQKYEHNNRAFTTPDRDHDRYPSGNCGAYYSSGWWFDACMAANLNGRYYKGSYKGVRDGIYWGTWPNISTEYYPTNDRQSFKKVRMLIRPRGFVPP
ncbi:titin-like [Gouania willdenowi]|uniref:Titin-like n=1 Tax=Gouania willdenowi TaxID=441366 RepID=A0A8C5DIJ1_GOUWI|nr:titin-like [Gouania willdenowi]